MDYLVRSRKSQISTFLLIFVALLLFIVSAFSYEQLWWFNWLLGSRVFLTLLSLGCIAFILKSKVIIPNLSSYYITFMSFIQATHGVLESASSVDFYNYVGIFFILNSLVYKGTKEKWLRIIFPIYLLYMSVPIYFKDPKFIGSFSDFIDNYTMSFIGLFVGSIIVIINSHRFELERALIHEKNHQQEIIQQQLVLLSKGKVDKAIAGLTKMLAHDLRKPLSQVKVMLDAFEMFKANPSRLETAKRDVKKAISNVEGMLADVMNYSRDVKLETSAKSLGCVLDFVIRQVVQQGSADIDISFKYNFRAGRKPLMDEGRFSRVLANIIGNGIEAITVIGKKKIGVIDITTNNFGDNKEKPFTEIIIGNDGHPFSEGVEDKLFESFYTSGKKKGTGLGLASAKKIVTLHDGEIFARNKFNGNGVEFVIRVPISNELEDIDEDLLPNHSDEVFQLEEDLTGIDVLVKKMAGNVYKTILLEDETLYRAWVKNLIQVNENLQKAVIFYDATTVDEALQLVVKEKPTHAVVDIDLGADKNGYDFLTAVKDNKGLKTIVHSNRTLDEFKQKAKDLGASAFVPKPLPLSSLVEFLTGEKIPVVKETLVKKKIRKIYCCDDTTLIRDHLDYIFKDYLREKPNTFEFEIFKKGEELIERAKKDKPTLIFTDLNMRESGGQLDGYEVITAVKKISRKTKAYLISNEPRQLSEEPTRKAGGDGALEQPLSKKLIFPILDKILSS